MENKIFKNSTLSLCNLCNRRLTFKDYREFLMQSAFSNNDFKKHNYAKNVIDDLISGKEVTLTKNINGSQILKLDKKEDEKIISALETVKDINEFNNALSDKGIKWTNIFKGAYSGYANGIASGNKGNAFENELLELINIGDEKVIENIKKAFNIDADKKLLAESVGGLNNKRPLIISGNQILIGGTLGPIGDVVSDINVKELDNAGKPTNKTYHISAKYGSTVTFCNVGVKKLFPTSYFEKDTELPADGKTLLEMFGINEQAFKNIFTNYNKNASNTVDAEKSIESNFRPDEKVFMNFIRSVIGYGYLMVHKNKGNIHYHNLITKNDLDNLIGNSIENYEIIYPKNGAYKRIDIKVRLKGIEIKFNIRSKDGGIYPTHLMSDYKFLKES